MEVVIDCYFDRMFADMGRNCLASRHKRRQLVKYFSDVINSCAEAEDITREDVCERIVQSALRFHNISMSDNGSVCMLGKFHNVLYIAAKLCYDWSIANNDIVSRLLNDIYYCERTFERIFVGAIFGTRVTHFLSGWKSDFDDRDENVRALVYFMDHAVAARLEYRCDASQTKRRFIDVPMESYGQVLPLRVAIQHGTPDILRVMLRYGASAEYDGQAPTPMEILLARLNEYDTGDDRRPGDVAATPAEIPQQLVACLRLLLRATPNACVRTPAHIAESCGVASVPLAERYPNLAERKIVPDDRSGVSPPELRHLARCRIRESLFENWALPHGIRELQIPESLRDYLDLRYD